VDFYEKRIILGINGGVAPDRADIANDRTRRAANGIDASESF
jgi:hypothetical protein